MYKVKIQTYIKKNGKYVLDNTDYMRITFPKEVPFEEIVKSYSEAIYQTFKAFYLPNEVEVKDNCIRYGEIVQKLSKEETK